MQAVASTIMNRLHYDSVRGVNITAYPFQEQYPYSIAVSSYNIVIRVESKQLDLYYYGKLYKIYPVAVGKPFTPTPRGNFTIINKAMNPGGPYGTRWMGLSKPHIGIHGTNNPASIGKAVSKGCIRMHNKDVEELFRLVSIGTAVRII